MADRTDVTMSLDDDTVSATTIVEAAAAEIFDDLRRPAHHAAIKARIVSPPFLGAPSPGSGTQRAQNAE